MLRSSLNALRTQGATLRGQAVHQQARRTLSAAGASRAVVTSTPQIQNQGTTGYAPSFTVYKARGAVSFKPITPTWKTSPGGGLRSVDRDGVLLCEFALNVGPRTYDWASKQNFALSVTELGDILLLGSHETSDPVKMFHDPNKGSATEGQMSKTLAFSPAPNGDYFLNLTVVEKPKANVQMSVALTKAEMRVLRSLAEFIIPRALGFDKVFEEARMM